jgi:hypothetical protein
MLVTACGDAQAAPLPTWTPPSALAAPAAESSPPPPSPAPSPPELVADPFDVSRISIPDLDAEAEVVDVGVTEDRILEVPPDARILGRWSDGARPGAGTGSIVLVSHVDFRGVPGVLKRLADLPVGAEATLIGLDGEEATYVVETIDVYRKAVLPYQDIFRFDVPERLVLITCGGEIDPSSGRYDSNVVTYFSRV